VHLRVTDRIRKGHVHADNLLTYYKTYEQLQTRKCAVDYYTTAYRRSESDATWRVMLLHIGYRPIE